MKFPSSNHRPQREPVPKTIESNAKLLDEVIEKVNWKRFIRIYWYGVSFIVGTIMLLILGIGIANKIVSIL